MKLFLKIFVIILLAFVGIGAIYGSWMFITDPSGTKFNMPLELLNNSPFKSYLIPGLVLLIVNGLFPIYIIISIIKRSVCYTWLLILQGCLLTGWLTIEILFNKNFFIPALHYPLYIAGLLFIIIGMVLLILNKEISPVRETVTGT